MLPTPMGTIRLMSIPALTEADRIAENAWSEPLENLAKAAQTYDRAARNVIGYAGSSPTDTQRWQSQAKWLLEVLQARSTLEAADNQRKTNRWLVGATWALVAATVALAVVAIWG